MFAWSLGGNPPEVHMTQGFAACASRWTADQHFFIVSRQSIGIREVVFLMSCLSFASIYTPLKHICCLRTTHVVYTVDLPIQRRLEIPAEAVRDEDSIPR